MEGNFLTSKEVIQLLNISQRTLTRKVTSGELKATRKKGKLHFPKDQFKGIVEKQEDNTTKIFEALQELKSIQDNDQSFKTVEKSFEALQKQLEIKDKEIERLQEQIKEKDLYHHQQLVQQQGLTKQLQDRFLMLEQPDSNKPKAKPKKRKKKKKKDGSNKKQQAKNVANDQKKERKGFLKWLLE